MPNRAKTRTCPICGREFTGGRKTCSDECCQIAVRASSLQRFRGISFEEAVGIAVSTPPGQDKKKKPAWHGLKIQYTRKCHDCGAPCLGYRCNACRGSVSEDYLAYY